ncbi:uncharacterized protein At2g29880-like [Aristolochia californica]|uniref:uncharacterized protein At2g29880-like n=1 Tax=Aristolochia californica TaxID=171875 RepID=UPI0035D78C70
MVVGRQPIARSYDIYTFEEDNKMLNEVWMHEEHRDAEKYKQQGCPLYEKLALVMGKSIAMGTSSIAPIDLGDKLLHDSDPVPMDEPENVDIVRETPSQFISRNDSTVEQSRRSKVSSSSHHRKISELPINDSSKFIDAVNRIAQALNSVMKTNEGDVEKDCVNALREIPDLSEDMKYGTPEWLDTPNKKAMFTTMTVEERVGWLKYCARKYL